jgi:hypothetical protein
VITIAVGGIFGIIALIAAVPPRHTETRVLFAGLGIACLLPCAYLGVLMNPWLIDARFRAYMSFYREINMGMTRAEVLAIRDRHYPSTGPRAQPMIMDNSPGGLGFFMNPEDSREPNCEGIFLTLKDDRVTKKSYSPD